MKSTNHSEGQTRLNRNTLINLNERNIEEKKRSSIQENEIPEEF